MFTDAQLVSVIPKLHGYAFKLTSNSADREDLVQQTLTRIWWKRHLYEDQGKFSSWCLVMMHNEWVNLNRDRYRDLSGHALSDDDVVDDEAEGSLVENRAVAPCSTDARVVVSDLARAMARLPTDQQTAIKLVALDGMSYDAAAQSLGIPVGTIRSRISRGRETLRELLWEG